MYNSHSYLRTGLRLRLRCAALRVNWNGQNIWSCIIYLTLLQTSAPMPPDKVSEKNDEATPLTQSSLSQQTSKVRNFFSIPAPVKTLFDQVPVLTYPPNELPQRAPKPARIPSLYVFIKKEDAAAGRPSYNPSCLKWQVRQIQIDLRTAF